MNFKSKYTPFLILGATSLVCSRILFLFFNDPEGPNLLVVVGMASAVYLLSLVAYALNSSTAGSKRLVLVILIQILLVVSLYFWLK